MTNFNADSISFSGDGYFHNHGGTQGFNIYAIVNGSTQTIFSYAGGVPADSYYLSGLGTIGFGGGTVTGIQIASTGYVGNAFHAFGDESFTLNVSGAVPEPGTWAMLLLGFGAIGVAMRRRKPSAAALPQVA